MLWCWEAPQDLRQVPEDTGIAFLAATIKVHSHCLSYTPRMQPLLTAPHAYVLPVVRIETERDIAPESEIAQAEKVAKLIAKLAAGNECRRVQIDFDARLKERAFYCLVLQHLRRQFPAGSTVSVTALASWCLDDCWTDSLAAQQVVPMFFSMGRGGREALAVATGRRTLNPANNQAAIGLSVAEPAVIQSLGESGLLKDRNIFLFASHGWTNAKAQKVEYEVKKWL